MQHGLKRVIISRTDRIGDVILSLPTFASLKKSFPECQAMALVSDYTADVARSSPNVDEVIIYKTGESIISAMRKLKKAHSDAILFLFPRFRLAAAAFLEGVPIRVGTAYRWYSFLFNKKVYEHRKDSVKSEAEYNLALAEVLGCNEKIMDASLSVDKTALESVDTFLNQACLSRFIVVHPGSGGSALEWGVENFRDVVKRITNELSQNVVATGTNSEHPICKKICEGIGNAINTAGRFSLLEFIALISKADLFISNSTGPLHLAAAVGTPVIGIYPNKKPMTSIRWSPLTEKKIILAPSDGSDDLSLITIDQVIQAARKLIMTIPQ